MPIYEFRCVKCGVKFEKLVSAAGGTAPGCPDCGCGDVKKLFSSFGFASSGKTNIGGGCSSCSSTSCSTCGMGG